MGKLEEMCINFINKYVDDNIVAEHYEEMFLELSSIIQAVRNKEWVLIETVLQSGHRVLLFHEGKYVLGCGGLLGMGLPEGAKDTAREVIEARAKELGIEVEE